MKLTDLLPLEEWVAFEQELHQRFGLDTNVFDINGYRISEFKQWANQLCPAIKATDKGQSFICAVAHMNVATQAMQSKAAVIEECDAGLVKIVIPIFVQDEFVGAVGACGALLDDGDVEPFLIEKITEIDEKDIERWATGLSQITTSEAEELCAFVEQRLATLIEAYEARQA